jgi:hypothetical protein
MFWLKAMSTLHLMPGYSPAGGLMQVLNKLGREEMVLAFPDDLSCGPIRDDESDKRADWWVWMYCGEPEDRLALMDVFWKHVRETNDQLVVWWGRHSSSEYAFFMALADRLCDRPFASIDVTGVRYSFTGLDGSRILSRATQRVSIMQGEGLAGLLDSQKPVNADERQESADRWRRLKEENAPFRILSPEGLISAPIECFDNQILEQISSEWQKTLLVLWNAASLNEEPYVQVSHYMLHRRLASLVDDGRVLADGDPCDARNSRVRLPDPR